MKNFQFHNHSGGLQSLVSRLHTAFECITADHLSTYDTVHKAWHVKPFPIFQHATLKSWERSGDEASVLSITKHLSMSSKIGLLSQAYRGRSACRYIYIITRIYPQCS